MPGKLIPIHNDDPLKLLEHGQRAMKEGRLDQTASYLDRAIRLSPEDVSILAARANLLLNQQRPQNALLLLERACNLDPDLAELWNNRGVALARLGRLDEATRCFHRALSILPDDPSILTNRAFTLLQLSRTDEARSDLLRVVEQRPDNADAWFYKAMLHARNLELHQGRHALLQAGKRTFASGGSKRRALALVAAASITRVLLLLGLGRE